MNEPNVWQDLLDQLAERPPPRLQVIAVAETGSEPDPEKANTYHRQWLKAAKAAGVVEIQRLMSNGELGPPEVYRI